MCITVITGFRQDPEGHFIAELACGHSQHVRHQPPWESRPWVISEAERAAKVGERIECPLCQMPALPSGARPYQRTAMFDENTVPPGLLRDHRTKPGKWARIVVEEGTLEYEIDSPARLFVLAPGSPGVAPPTVRHAVRPLGHVRFYVEFLQLDA